MYKKSHMHSSCVKQLLHLGNRNQKFADLIYQHVDILTCAAFMLFFLLHIFFHCDCLSIFAPVALSCLLSCYIL